MMRDDAFGLCRRYWSGRQNGRPIGRLIGWRLADRGDRGPERTAHTVAGGAGADRCGEFPARGPGGRRRPEARNDPLAGLRLAQAAEGWSAEPAGGGGGAAALREASGRGAGAAARSFRPLMHRDRGRWHCHPCGRRGGRGASRARDPGGAGGLRMIAPGGDLKVYVATRPVDFRKGIDGLALAVQEMFGLDPFCGAAFVFRSKRADRIKVLVWDRTGMVLVHKRLEGTKFVWPQVRNGVMRMSPAQFAALFEGL